MEAVSVRRHFDSEALVNNAVVLERDASPRRWLDIGSAAGAEPRRRGLVGGPSPTGYPRQTWRSCSFWPW